MKKILMINTVEYKKNGISTVINNIIENINQNKYKVSLVLINEIDEMNEKRLKDLNVEVVDLGYRKKSYIAYAQFMIKLSKHIRHKKYDIFHVHGNSGTMFMDLLIAKVNKIPIRICHAHNNHTDHPLINNILKMGLPWVCTVAVACSDIVGEWLYGKGKYNVIRNGINVDNYQYNNKQREDAAKIIGIEEELLIGHIGLFNEQKNHMFMIDLLKAYLSKNSNTKMLFIGDGDRKISVINYAKQLGVEENIIILSNRSDISILLNRIDMFVFPSIYEGFGIALLEAQANGINCYASDQVSRAVNITGRVTYLPLKVNEWVEKITSIDEQKRKSRSIINLEMIKTAKYDTKSSLGELFSIYEGRM